MRRHRPAVLESRVVMPKAAWGHSHEQSSDLEVAGLPPSTRHGAGGGGEVQTKMRISDDD